MISTLYREPYFLHGAKRRKGVQRFYLLNNLNHDPNAFCWRTTTVYIHTYLIMPTFVTERERYLYRIKLLSQQHTPILCYKHLYNSNIPPPHHHHHHHQISLNREGRWGITDDFATSFLHFSLFSTALWDLPNSRPVHSLMLSSHLFLCPPCLLPPFTVPCKMVLARPDERETRPYHCSLRACWILARTSSLVERFLLQVGLLRKLDLKLLLRQLPFWDSKTQTIKCNYTSVGSSFQTLLM